MEAEFVNTPRTRSSLKQMPLQDRNAAFLPLYDDPEKLVDDKKKKLRQ